MAKHFTGIYRTIMNMRIGGLIAYDEWSAMIDTLSTSVYRYCDLNPNINRASFVLKVLQ